MPLGPGEKLGPYEILAPLGAGGMGEVYRARDARLAREVAVKVLPAGFSSDSDRLRRFEQEARAAGSLNHPNILAVHDTGHHQGAPYVVSELLEGETLRERAQGGALPVRKAVEIGAQIARGLAAAHEKGIVHRDLKPENVFVASDGQVKILDFGLAKLTQPEAGSGLSQSPTEARGTDAGTVLGTIGYMSPEQVRGVAVDHRSDIFSLGAILYELLAGRRAFRKETSAETMTAILREDPPELTETNRALPPALERIVSHCLEKNPQERFASARDLAFDLEALSEKSAASGTALRMHGAAGRRRAAAVSGWLATVVLASGFAFWIGRRAVDGHQPRYQQLSFGHGTVYSAAFSPDGASVLYSARWSGGPERIFSLRLDLQLEQPLGFEGRLVGAAGGELAFLRSDKTLLRAPVSGGGAREVATGVDSADWARDGMQFAVTRRVGPKQVLEYPIGKVLYESAGDLFWPRISPDGLRVAVVEQPSLGVNGGRLMLVDAAGARRLSADNLVFTNLAWSADGREVWFTLREGRDDPSGVYAAPLSGGRRILVATSHNPTLHDVRTDGGVLLSLGQGRRQVAGLASGDSAERDLSLRGNPESYDISDDGRRYLVSAWVGGAQNSAFLGGLDGAPLVRLGSGLCNSLSPDGRTVLVWNDTGEGAGTGLTLLPTGAGQPRDVPRGSIRTYMDTRFLPDGRRLLLSASEAGRPRRMFVQDLPDGPPKPVTPEGVFTAYAFATPDGAWVPAGSDWESEPYKLYPLAGGDPRPIRGLEKGDQPLRFTADGQKLYLRVGAPDDIRAAIVLLDLATGRRQPWRVLTPADGAGVTSITYVFPTPDGRGYVYDYFRTLSDLFLVTELK